MLPLATGGCCSPLFDWYSGREVPSRWLSGSSPWSLPCKGGRSVCVWAGESMYRYIHV